MYLVLEKRDQVEQLGDFTSQVGRSVEVDDVIGVVARRLL